MEALARHPSTLSWHRCRHRCLDEQKHRTHRNPTTSQISMVDPSFCLCLCLCLWRECLQDPLGSQVAAARYKSAIEHDIDILHKPEGKRQQLFGELHDLSPPFPWLHPSWRLYALTPEPMNLRGQRQARHLRCLPERLSLLPILWQNQTLIRARWGRSLDPLQPLSSQ